MKRCPKCNEEKDKSLFPHDSSRKDGLYSRCKDCVNAEWRARYRNGYKEQHLKKRWMDGDKERIKSYNQRKRRKWGVKIRAQTILRNAVKSGKVTKLPCEVCGNVASQGHHEDYKMPLVVRWLCDLHHKEVHERTITYHL